MNLSPLLTTAAGKPSSAKSTTARPNLPNSCNSSSSRKTARQMPFDLFQIQMASRKLSPRFHSGLASTSAESSLLYSDG